MRSLLVVAFLSFAILPTQSAIDTSRGVQIISPVNHSYILRLEELKQILEVDEIKNRHVAVVSITGAFRQGKSFLLNFFIRYLNAQYKKHDVTDWIGGQGNSSVLNGFKFRNGRKLETTGIWMWSEIFTHDYENGEKVAIILLDTQGIFDSKSSVREYTTIFALSMMLSSVLCYNLMNNIRENDLEHLELFTEYSRLALQQTNEKPFQYLLLIVRDWPFPYEIDYGWHGQELIEELFVTSDDQTDEMDRLRQRLNSSFQEIGAFLMPHPGFNVARSRNFTGDLRQIDPDFIKYVKELAPALFAPENLVVKQVNGQKVRARDFVQYIQSYLNIFTGTGLPEAKTLLMATAEANSLIIYNDYMNFYSVSMQDALNKTSFFSTNELLLLHNRTKNETVIQFQDKAKLGGDEFWLKFLQKIQIDIDEKLHSFQAINEMMRINFTRLANAHNEKLVDEIKKKFKLQANQEFSQYSQTYLTDYELDELCKRTRREALREFNRQKMGNNELYRVYRDSLDIFFASMRKNFEETNLLMKLSYTLDKFKWI